MWTDRAAAHTPDWTAARRRAHEEGWARRVLGRVREDFFRNNERMTIPGPDTPSEWTHHYFCDDGAALRFDPLEPDTHVCPTCGRTYTGEPYHGAWVTKMHNLAASHAQRAALLLRLADDAETRASARTALVRIIATYARTYSQYELHGDKVGKGRVHPQNLDESVWVIALLRSVRWTEDLLPDETIACAEQLAGGVAAALEPQLGMVHNIHCWIAAALAECAVRTGDRALLDRARSGPYGVETQIVEGFRAEELWYETSVFYHFYALAALLSYCEAAGSGGLTDSAARTLARALEAPARLAYSDALLPAYNDCWPTGYLDDYAGHVAVAATVLPEFGIDTGGYRERGVRERPVDLWIGSRWDDGTGSRPLSGPCSVAELVFGPGPAPAAPAGSGPAPSGRSERADTARGRTVRAPRGRPELGPSFVWPDTGLGVLCSDHVRVGMRFGPDVGMHDHHDALGVDVETADGWRSLDLGSSGYTAAFTRWTQSPCAHNITVVRDASRPPADGVLEDWTPTSMSASVSWDDVAVRRTIRLTDDGWSDETHVDTDGPGPLMWIFHGDGSVEASSDPCGTDGPVGSAPGSEWYRGIRHLDSDGHSTVRVTWRGPGTPVAHLELPPGAQAFSALATGNPSGAPLGVVLVRTNACAMTVRARFVVGA